MIKVLTFLILLFPLLGFGSDFETRVLLDKTYIRDNSYCRVQNDVVEFEVRSFERYSQPDDTEYGEHIFALHGDKRVLLPLNADGLGRYKLFKSKNSLCSKVMAIKLEADVLAVFFLKDNRPLGNLLTVLYYNMKDQSSKVMHTDFTTSRGFIQNGKLKFPSLQLNEEAHMGKVTHEGLTYIHRDAEVVDWLSFDGSKIQLDFDLTYQKFDGKHLFTRKEFEKFTNYDSQKNQYQQKRYVVAINHLLKRRCLAFSNLPALKIPAFLWHCR